MTTADWERVGEEFGFTGLVGRVRLRFEGADGNPPASVVVKLPSARDDVSFERHVRELRFYRELDVPFAPRLYYGAADDEQRRSILLLEDLSAGRQGDVLQGCSVDDAARVLAAVAPFHARWWAEAVANEWIPAFRRRPAAATGAVRPPGRPVSRRARCVAARRPSASSSSGSAHGSPSSWARCKGAAGR